MHNMRVDTNPRDFEPPRGFCHVEGMRHGQAEPTQGQRHESFQVTATDMQNLEFTSARSMPLGIKLNT